MDLNEHPEFQYAEPADLALIETAASPSDWPASTAARVGHSMVRYTKEMLEKNRELFGDEMFQALHERMTIHGEALNVLASHGDKPVDKQWGRYLTELSTGCNQALMGLEAGVAEETAA